MDVVEGMCEIDVRHLVAIYVFIFLCRRCQAVNMLIYYIGC